MVTHIQIANSILMSLKLVDSMGNYLLINLKNVAEKTL